MSNADNPLVSVIIPTWNRANYIARAIQSVLDQTYQNFEILVCDDGSTDNTEDIVKSFKDSRIIWVEGERGGRPAIPRNRGIKKANGEWLAFLDSDDYWLPNKLEKQLKILKASEKKVISTNAFFVRNGEITNEILIKTNQDLITFKDLLKGNNIINSSTLINKNLFETTIGFPEDVEFTAVEDYALWLRIAVYTDFIFIPEALVAYNDEPNISIRKETPRSKYYEIKKNIVNNFIEWAEEKRIDTKFIKQAKAEYLKANTKNILISPFKKIL